MTTFTPTTDLETDPLDPVTSELMTGLKLNPVAISEGDPTAPRVSSLALGPIIDIDDAINTDADAQTLAQIDLGAARGAVVEGAVSISVGIGSAGGTSRYRIQGSTDDITYTSLTTLSTAFGVSETVVVRAAKYHSQIGGTAYRYFRVRADGPSGHDVDGYAMIRCVGTEDES